MEQKHNYWVVAVSCDSPDYFAFIVEADTPEEIYDNPSRTLGVTYGGLKYKYRDTEEETQKEIRCRKSMINPEIVFNPKIKLEEILSLPEVKSLSEEQLKNLKENAEDIREAYRSAGIHKRKSDLYINILEDVKKELQEKYNETKSLSEQELYKKIKEDFVQKSRYMPKEISKVTPYFLERAGHLMGLRKFESLENAMKELYLMWEDINLELEKKHSELDEISDVVAKSWFIEAIVLDKAVNFFKPKDVI